MKRIVLLFSLALCACSPSIFDKDSPIVFKERQDIILSDREAGIVDNCNSFAFNILHNLYPNEQNKELFLSPLSLSIAFSMLNNGANANTYSQIQNALGFNDYHIEEVNNTFKKLSPALAQVDNSTKFKQANAMWFKQTFTLNNSFSNTLKNYYNATISNLDFGAPGASDIINSWVNDNTDGMIPCVIDRADPSWNYVIANALYFKGVWGKKFDANKTQKEDFNCYSGQKRQMEFMRGDVSCKYSYCEGLSAALCELPFGNGAFVLDILLPDDDIHFDNFISELSVKEWNAIVSSLYSCEKYVIIPKLDLKYKSNDSIINAFKALGVEDVFDSTKADLSGIGNTPTYLSTLIHSARFKMDENGAEAASVTFIGANMMDAGPSKEFFADHPFVFAIREISTGVILFIGAYRGL